MIKFRNLNKIYWTQKQSMRQLILTRYNSYKQRINNI